ncbi:MAG: transcriptional regulator [bacterium]|nr:transcriptional regulator [bacterium]
MAELILTDHGQRLKKIRESLSLSQTAMGGILCSTKNTVQLLEKGAHKCLYDLVYNLSALLNVNLNFLFHGKGGMFAGKSGQTLPEVVVGAAIENYDQLIWYLQKSPFMRNRILEFASKYLYKYDDLIRIDLDKNKFKPCITFTGNQKFNPSLLISFGQRVRIIRENTGLTQVEFARAINKSRSNIIKIEKGLVKCGYDVLFYISDVFGVNIYYLVHGLGDVFMDQPPSIPGGIAIGDCINSMDQLQWYLEASPLVLYSAVSAATRILYENESVITKELT